MSAQRRQFWTHFWHFYYSQRLVWFEWNYPNHKSLGNTDWYGYKVLKCIFITPVILIQSDVIELLANTMESVDITDNENKQVCEVCSKSFSTKAVLKQHRLIYEHLEVFPCLLCKKTFSTASHLKRHKLVHTGEKPHQCTSCEKTFSQAGDLRSHQLTHTNEKPYILQCVQNHSP